MCANAAYGYCGADTSSLSGPPLAEACLRWGSFYCREAARLVKERWPERRVVYAATDSVFVEMPGGCSVSDAVAAGEAMAAHVSASLPACLDLEFEKVLSPFVLMHNNRYAGAEHTRASLAARSQLAPEGHRRSSGKSQPAEHADPIAARRAKPRRTRH